MSRRALEAFGLAEYRAERLTRPELCRLLQLETGTWNAAMVGGAVYVAAVIFVMMVLPSVDEVPAGFSADTLWRFRLASIGIHTVVWTAIGLTFGALTETPAAGPGSACDSPACHRGGVSKAVYTLHQLVFPAIIQAVSFARPWSSVRAAAPARRGPWV